jgi:hypothetical protein
MSTYSALTIPTQFVDVGNIRLAYRQWGKPGGLPLVFLKYFSGNLDDWDPLVTDALPPIMRSSCSTTPGLEVPVVKRRALSRR